MNKITELSKKDLKKYVDFLTVGRLKEFLNEHNLPDDAIVVVERVEDVYYEKYDWGVYLKKGEHYHSAKRLKKDIKKGIYPKAKDLKPYTKEEMKEMMEQYHPVWCCARYKDDKDILFLNLHY